MKKLTAFLLAAMLPAMLYANPEIRKPKIKSATTFAVVVDSRSYAEAKAEINAYCDVLEEEQLGTYLLVDEWASPDVVREQLIRLAGERTPLEGAVFIGNIPIAMVRDAQHLTSAFKMNQANDWKESSVPSDRFYDDFDMKFEFLKQDADNAAYFYYSLSPESTQHIASDIYTARIRPPHREGVDSYELLRNYLRKVVKAHREQNALDNMFVFRGHGYNSESLDAWSGEQKAMKEQLPRLFMTGNKMHFYNYDTRWPMKPYLLECMEQPGVDIALCHHHGAPDTQYINGYPNTSEIPASIDNVKRYLRSKLYDADNYEEAKAYFMKRLGVSEEWCEVSDSLRVADSIYNYALDIHIEELHNRKLNPRFVIFDACYNGSFHLDDCIASSYIFSEGDAVITQANSVNALQDKWPDRYMGLLDCGVRVGQWGRHVHYLETHLIGDPTYRFTNRSMKGVDFGRDMVTRHNDVKYWLKYVDDKYPVDIESMALRRLSECGYVKLNDLLYERSINSQYANVRLEALTLLSTKHSPLFIEALKIAVKDSYELIRRLGTSWLSNCGNDELIPAAAEVMTEDFLSKRVYFQLDKTMSFFEPDKTIAVLKEAFAAKPYLYKGDERLAFAIRGIENQKERFTEKFENVGNKEIPMKSRMREITYFRNYRHHNCVPALIKVAEGAEYEESLRVAAVEALGWFYNSWQRPTIEQMCERMAKNEKSEALRKEAVKTFNRLKAY